MPFSNICTGSSNFSDDSKQFSEFVGITNQWLVIGRVFAFCFRYESQAEESRPEHYLSNARLKLSNEVPWSKLTGWCLRFFARLALVNPIQNNTRKNDSKSCKKVFSSPSKFEQSDTPVTMKARVHTYFYSFQFITILETSRVNETQRARCSACRFCHHRLYSENIYNFNFITINCAWWAASLWVGVPDEKPLNTVTNFASLHATPMGAFCLFLYTFDDNYLRP